MSLISRPKPPKPAKNPQTTSKIQATKAKKPEKTPEEAKICEKRQAYYQRNRARLRAKATERNKTLGPADRAIARWRGYAKPPSPRAKHPNSQNARRQQDLSVAYCEFSDADEVVRIYMACAVMNELAWTQERYVVDHQVPLSGSPLVDGLAVHCNLEVVLNSENRLKGYTFWPDMWPQDWSTMDLLRNRP